jgi:hypothetical protein
MTIIDFTGNLKVILIEDIGNYQQKERGNGLLLAFLML